MLRINENTTFLQLALWGGNAILLELCQQLLTEDRHYTPQQQAVIVSNMASVWGVLGQKQEALKYYEQALQLHKKVQNPFMEGITLHNMGMIYSGQDRNDVAFACILLAKVLFERVQSPSDVEDEVQWIADLRKRIGEQQFTALLAQIEPRAEQIVEEALRKGSGDQ